MMRHVPACACGWAKLAVVSMASGPVWPLSKSSTCALRSSRSNAGKFLGENNSLPFLDRDCLSRSDARNFVDLSTWPLNLKKRNIRLLAQTKGKHQFALRKVA